MVALHPGALSDVEFVEGIKENLILVDDGSMLVREISPFPVPAAVWLFGTAMIGLVGFGRHKKSA
jgi:hypothetical protein